MPLPLQCCVGKVLLRTLTANQEILQSNLPLNKVGRNHDIGKKDIQSSVILVELSVLGPYVIHQQDISTVNMAFI